MLRYLSKIFRSADYRAPRRLAVPLVLVGFTSSIAAGALVLIADLAWFRPVADDPVGFYIALILALGCFTLGVAGAILALTKLNDVLGVQTEPQGRPVQQDIDVSTVARLVAMAAVALSLAAGGVVFIAYEADAILYVTPIALVAALVFAISAGYQIVHAPLENPKLEEIDDDPFDVDLAIFSISFPVPDGVRADARNTDRVLRDLIKEYRRAVADTPAAPPHGVARIEALLNWRSEAEERSYSISDLPWFVLLSAIAEVRRNSNARIVLLPSRDTERFLSGSDDLDALLVPGANVDGALRALLIDAFGAPDFERSFHVAEGVSFNDHDEIHARVVSLIEAEENPPRILFDVTAGTVLCTLALALFAYNDRMGLSDDPGRRIGYMKQRVRKDVIEREYRVFRAQVAQQLARS